MNIICISKKFIWIGLVVVLLLSFVSMNSIISNAPKVLNSKAAQNITKNKIIGSGTVDANKGEFPYIALLSNGCTGSLIAEEWVLTAAHCIQGYMTEPLRIAIGINNKNDFDSNSVLAYGAVIPTKSSLIDSVLQRPSKNEIESNSDIAYSPENNTYNDIALIKLPRKYSNIRLPKIASGEGLYKEGDNVTVVGWGCVKVLPEANGELEVDGNKYHRIFSKILQKNTTFPIARSEVPDRPHEFFIGYDDDRSMEFSICQGDSGGPILNWTKKNTNTFIIGVQSKSGMTIRKQYVMPTKTAPFYDWIQEIITDRNNDKLILFPTPNPQQTNPPYYKGG